MSIDEFLYPFAHLHVNVNRYHWPEETFYRAPYKPILLLSVVDLIGLNIIQENFISFDDELLETFNLYCNQAVGSSRNSGMILPFFHLRSESFWDLIPVIGMKNTLEVTKQVDTLTQLRKLVLGARLDDDLFILIQNPLYRDQLKSVLIQTYFVPEIQEKLLKAGRIKVEAFKYGQTLMIPSSDRFKIKDEDSDHQELYQESRSVAFRSVVRMAYDYTCAMCGIRVLTPEGATAVEASHIVPWHVSHNDDPRNGLALCGLHHWVFDQGLVCIDGDFRVKISPVIEKSDLGSEPLRNLNDSEIHKPLERFFWPAKQALSWHRKRVFRC